jgi:hypothetical protein
MNEHIRKLILSAALWALFPAVYLGLWHWCNHAGITWPVVLNIPGLLILALAWPWSTSALELVFFHGSAVGAAGSALIHVAVILGFGVNLALLSALARHLFRRFAARSDVAP